MNQTQALRRAIKLAEEKRRQYAPEYNAGIRYGATGESIDRATRAYIKLTKLIEKLAEMISG